MEDTKAQLLTRIRESTNVLVTVSNNPSLDQLAGAIGLTLLLNKLGKHATAVFSGEVPSIIEYLRPEETIEKNTDSLRDFIIALDKSKADKLRYKVEDRLVKIFITPYRTALTEADLEFSQGDFNVDVVIALGVHEQRELDQAITSHGRILHDATVSSINNKTAGNLGTINWVDTKASSLCEMLYTLSDDLKADALDAQMATALLTGIVAETRRFANERTTARSMAISSQLVAAGANQQLVAAKLQEKSPEPAPLPPPPPPKVEKPEPPKPKPEPPKPQDVKVFKPAPKIKQDEPGTLQVVHEEDLLDEEQGLEEIRIDEHGVLFRPTEEPTEAPAGSRSTATNEEKDKATNAENEARRVTEPPTRGGQLTANTEPEALSPAIDPLAGSKDGPLLSRSKEDDDTSTSLPMPSPDNTDEQEIDSASDSKTLDDIEKDVASPHQQATTAPLPPDLEAARDAVVDAVNSGPSTSPLEPRFDLNAQPGLELNQPPLAGPPNAVPLTNPGLPGNLVSPSSGPVDLTAAPMEPTSTPPLNTTVSSLPVTSPPPVPPPMMPPSFLSQPPTEEDSTTTNSGTIPNIPL